ncbi:hypothetical protein AK89_09375 [Enterococcus mundtii CRL35]|nr:hypothetical protein AK89_09375 [Enterococcus mundtii CRL35]
MIAKTAVDPISKKTAPSSLTIIGGEGAVILTIEDLL